MALNITRPFVDSRAFNKDTSEYVTFPTHSDAMLASLQLFQDVPCRIMDLIFSVVLHPEFDIKQVTLGSSAGIIKCVEEARLKDRMVVVHERSLNNEGIMEQAGLPQFVLEEVLDIIEADKVARIKARFEKNLSFMNMQGDSRVFFIEEDVTLSKMCLVHRSWTHPAQKALGRSLYIGRPIRHMDFLLRPQKKSIFGPWTSLVAVDLYHPMKGVYGEGKGYTWSFDYAIHDEYRQMVENLHRLLVCFKDLKQIYIRSHASFFTKWLDVTVREMVRQNTSLQGLSLYATEGSFHLNYLGECDSVASLESLTVQGIALFEDMETTRNALLQGADSNTRAGIRNLTLKGLGWASTKTPARKLWSFQKNLATLSHLSKQSYIRLESLTLLQIWDPSTREIWPFTEMLKNTFTPSQLTNLSKNLRALHVSCANVHVWIEWIGPYCANLKQLTIKTMLDYHAWPELLNSVPRTIQVLDLRLSNIQECVQNSKFKGWTEDLLELPGSRRFPELKSLTLGLADYEKVDIMVFHEKMKSNCCETGITYI